MSSSSSYYLRGSVGQESVGSFFLIRLQSHCPGFSHFKALLVKDQLLSSLSSLPASLTWLLAELTSCWLLVGDISSMPYGSIGLVTMQQLFSIRVWALRKGKRQSKRRWATCKLQSFCNLILEVTSPDACHLLVIRSKSCFQPILKRRWLHRCVNTRSKDHLELFSFLFFSFIYFIFTFIF